MVIIEIQNVVWVIDIFFFYLYMRGEIKYGKIRDNLKKLVQFESSCRYCICLKLIKMFILFFYFVFVLYVDRKRNFNISVMVVGLWKVCLIDWIIQLIEFFVYKKKNVKVIL